MSEEHNQSASASDGTAGHVLIVDDDAEIRNLTANRPSGYGGVTAGRCGRRVDQLEDQGSAVLLERQSAEKTVRGSGFKARKSYCMRCTHLRE
jgi:hypothetical protein